MRPNLLLAALLLCFAVACQTGGTLQVYGPKGWTTPNWSGNPELDRAMVLNNRRELEQAFKAFQKLDAQGVATATAMLGRYYEKGRWVARDQGLALQYYTKARAMNDGMGAYHYARFQGRDYDPEELAFFLPLLKKEEARGNILSKAVLAVWLLKHPGLFDGPYEDSGLSLYGKARELTEEASAAGYAPAQANLVWMGSGRDEGYWEDMVWKNGYVSDEL